VLYIQHAGSLGGSCVSLLNLLMNLDKGRYDPVVALIRPSPDLVNFYEGHGFKTVPWEGIETFEHTTAAWTSPHRPLSWIPLYRTLAGWSRTAQRTRALVESAAPDVVHLNSAVLLPTALALARQRTPFVWHIRESPVKAHRGCRTRFLGRKIRELTPARIFLSAHQKLAWIGSASGDVIPNPVDPSLFSISQEKSAARRTLGLPEAAPVLLYLGGVSRIKGAHVVLKAIREIRESFPGVICLMPGSSYVPSSGYVSRSVRFLMRSVGSGTDGDAFERGIRRYAIEPQCVRSDFSVDISTMLAACDMLVFPALRDHFSRPVAEAGAAARPVIVSRLPSLEEQVENGKSGLVIPCGDAKALAAAVSRLIRDPALCEHMGARARHIAAERYDPRKGAARIMELYDEMV
jgi:glycosyltransferase involved in cell wall biosynthesis